MSNVFFKEIVLTERPDVKVLVRIGFDVDREDSLEGDLFVEQKGVVGCHVVSSKEWFRDKEVMMARFNTINTQEDLVFDISKLDRMIEDFKIFFVENTQMLVSCGKDEPSDKEDEDENSDPYYISFLSITEGLGEANVKIRFNNPTKMTDGFHKVTQKLVEVVYADVKKFYN